MPIREKVGITEFCVYKNSFNGAKSIHKSLYISTFILLSKVYRSQKRSNAILQVFVVNCKINESNMKGLISNMYDIL